MPKLLLLDGHSLAYRAFYALPTDLSTSAGTVTNAVFGFTSMLTKVLGDEQPDYIAVAFDTPKPTFRDAMDPNYKAGRKETPDVFALPAAAHPRGARSARRSRCSRSRASRPTT